ncbi:MAG: cation diffusion facilitator family transporter [Magnetospiraceae bacterium]
MAETPITKERSDRLMRAATYAAVGVASLLVIVKLFAWFATESVAMLSTLIDSLLDVAASLVNFFAVRHALMPADREHRFGHGKAEPLAGLAQAAFISGSALFLLLQAGERLIRPRDISQSEVGLLVMGIAIVATLGLLMFQRYVVAKTGSVAIKADSLHYKTDVLVNISVGVSLVLSANFGLNWVDPVFALAIAAYILHGAWEIAGTSLKQLMDQELPKPVRKRIIDIAKGHDDVMGVHDLRTRAAGNMAFIQFHIEVPRNMNIVAAHDVADEVMESVMAAIPNSEVLIHQDPVGVQEDRDTF